MCKLHLGDIINNNFESKKNIIKNTFPKELGNDYMENIKIQDDFNLVRTNYLLNTPIQIEAKQTQKKFVITICQKGNTKFKDDNGQAIDFKEGFTTICFYNKTQGVRQIQDKQIIQTRLVIDEDFLQRNLKESLIEKYFYENKNNLNIMDFSPTNLSTQFLLNEIESSSLTGDLKAIYDQSKALELLYLEVSKLQENKNEIFLDDYDKDAIYRAKEILIQNMQNPPSIIQLAKQVHINEFKLKKGFKQIFKTTPYKLLYQYKMNHAKELLKSSDYNISEIANIIGYKFPNNFTNAFYNEFKINPKDLMKTRKYY